MPWHRKCINQSDGGELINGDTFQTMETCHKENKGPDGTGWPSTKQIQRYILKCDCAIFFSGPQRELSPSRKRQRANAPCILCPKRWKFREGEGPHSKPTQPGQSHG